MILGQFLLSFFKISVFSVKTEFFSVSVFLVGVQKKAWCISSSFLIAKRRQLVLLLWPLFCSKCITGYQAYILNSTWIASLTIWFWQFLKTILWKGKAISISFKYMKESQRYVRHLIECGIRLLFSHLTSQEDITALRRSHTPSVKQSGSKFEFNITSASKCVSYFTSKKMSATSCMTMTSVPTRVRLQVHEKHSNDIVVKWWMNISQKSFRLTSVNWEIISDQ